MEQNIVTPGKNYEELDNWIAENKCGKIMLVFDGSLQYQHKLCVYFEKAKDKGLRVVGFNDFQPNPLYENVQAGVKLFRDKECDSIIAIGGGSAMDVAKCIKLYSGLEGDGEKGSWLKTDSVENDIPFLVIPTTAGTGSEATRYAVIYYDDKKQSVTNESIIPRTVLMDPDCLITLPEYQKKATLLDALCHAIESYWSVNSTDESKKYSQNAIELIMTNLDEYLSNASEESRSKMLLAANLAGKAINITQTTAGHAMCYKITSLFGCAHGHAAALCNRVLFQWMIHNTERCIDSRGEKYLKGVLDEIGQIMGGTDAIGGAKRFTEIFSRLDLEVPVSTEEQYEELRNSVNPERLKNFPISLDLETINMLYHKILR